MLNQKEDFYDSEEEKLAYPESHDSAESSELRISSKNIEKNDAVKSSSGEKVPLVIDIGSIFTRFGYADAEDRGIEIHRSVVGNLRQQISTKKEKFYGNTAAQKSRNGVLLIFFKIKILFIIFIFILLAKKELEI